MGTHNRLLRIDSPSYPSAYLEILAVDPDAPPAARARWFGLDAPALQAAVRQQPRLVHAVLRTPNVEMLRWGLVNLGLNPGEPLSAERDTPQGKLQWRILVRADGAIDAHGALPTLIQWQGPHPADAMAASPVQLKSLALAGLPPAVRTLLRPQATVWQDAADAPALDVTLNTPLGERRLQAWAPT